MSLPYLKYLIKNNLQKIRVAMTDIGIDISSGVTLDDWDFYLRTVFNDPYASVKPNNVKTPVGRAQFLMESLINLRQAINDLQDDTLVTGIPLEDWPGYIRKIIFNWTGCRTYVIRLGDNLGDISVAPRRLSAGHSPDVLYSVYVEDGVAKTAIKQYSDVNLNYGWVDQATLGSAHKVALAFDGHWERVGEVLHLVTDGEPYIFWTDSNKTLFRQKWGQPETKDILAEDVIAVKAIRAWKNFKFPGKDAGVVCAYIKTDGTVYYRAWAEQENETYIWESETHVEEFTGTAVSLNLFITNDYRTGIIIEDVSGDVHWFITGRDWAGMALVDHKVTVSSKIEANLIPIKYWDLVNEDIVIVSSTINSQLEYAGLANEFIRIKNIEVDGNWGTLLEFELQHKLFGGTKFDFIIEDTDNNEYTPTGITQIDETTYRLEFVDFNNVDQEGVLKYLAIDGKNIIGNLYNTFNKTFYPVNLVPLVAEAPEVEAIFNE